MSDGREHVTPAGIIDGATSGIRQKSAEADRPAEETTVRADIVPGGVFPDYEPTDHTNTRRRLSELQGIDPMILVISRGHFCPKDHQQHLELAANYPKIAVAYTQIVTIRTDNILEINDFRESVGAQWTSLSDAGRKVQKDLQIKEYTDPYHDPMIPHTLVLKPALVIHSVYNGYWFCGRPSFEYPCRDLREITHQIGLTGIWAYQGCARHGTPAIAPGTTLISGSIPLQLDISATEGANRGIPCHHDHPRSRGHVRPNRR